jgi:hypothetical protein
VPWFAPVVLAVLGVVALWASRHVEAWMAANQERGRQLLRSPAPVAGSLQAKTLVLSQRFARWFLVAAGLSLVIGAAVIAVAIAI